MELLFELLGALLQFLAELVLQLVVEILAELFGQSLRGSFRNPKPLHPLASASIYAALGAAAGALSLLVFPLSVIDAQWLRVANLVVTPVLVGLMMSIVGAWRLRRGDDLIRLDRFSYGYLFALAMAAVRFAWTGP